MNLPVLIEKYIKASNDSDVTAVVSCFTEDATVLDEGETLQGRQAVGQWFTKNKNKYQHTTEPVSVIENGNEILMKAKVTGKFAGSPAVLSYSIKTKNGLIQDIRIS